MQPSGIYAQVAISRYYIPSSLNKVMEEVGKTWENRAGEEPLHAIPSMLWSQVHHTLQPLVELNMGSGDCHVIRWSHRYFSECAVSRYLNSEDKARQIHGDLADYFSGKFAITHEEEGKCHNLYTSDLSLPLMSQDPPLPGMTVPCLHCLASHCSWTWRRAAIM